MINRFTLAIIAALAFAGCGSQVAPTGGTPQPLAPATNGKSWMLPEAKGEDLLYVSNAPDVLVFSYPKGKLVGTIANLQHPIGLCSDSNGNVFVVNRIYGGFKDAVIEFPHGGTGSTQTFMLARAAAYCSVAPESNDLAVTTQVSTVARVDIFAHETQRKRPHSLVELDGFNSCAYDNHGLLFLDGQTLSSNAGVLTKLNRDGHGFTSVTLSQPPEFMGQLQWDGKYLAMGDFHASIPPLILRVRISHGVGQVTGTTTLQGDLNGVFWIAGHIVIAATSPAGVSLYRYPAGGGPIKSLPQKYFNLRNGAWGLAVSVAPSAPRKQGATHD